MDVGGNFGRYVTSYGRDIEETQLPVLTTPLPLPSTNVKKQTERMRAGLKENKKKKKVLSHTSFSFISCVQNVSLS
jgi:hypothetical protein